MEFSHDVINNRPVSRAMQTEADLLNQQIREGFVNAQKQAWKEAGTESVGIFQSDKILEPFNDYQLSV